MLALLLLLAAPPYLVNEVGVPIPLQPWYRSAGWCWDRFGKRQACPVYPTDDGGAVQFVPRGLHGHHCMLPTYEVVGCTPELMKRVK